MRFWIQGFFNAGYWGMNYWAPGGFISTAQPSFAGPQTQFYTVSAGQTLGGPSGAGTPFTVQSN